MQEKVLYKMILLLGSNLPYGGLSPQQIIEEADKEIIAALLPDYMEIDSLEQIAFTTEIIQTEPCGIFKEDVDFVGNISGPTPPFFNQILCCITDKAPLAALEETFRIENLFGRKRTYKEKGKVYQSRTLDIDILEVYRADNKADNRADKDLHWIEIKEDSKKLTLPHPQIRTRPFVKELLAMLPRDQRPASKRAGQILD